MRRINHICRRLNWRCREEKETKSRFNQYCSRNAKVTTAPQKIVASRPKVVISTKTLAQKVSAAPKKAAIAFPKAIVLPVKIAIIARRRDGQW